VGYRQLPFDGGMVEYVVDGPDDASDLLLFHLGTPCAAVPFDGLTRAAAAAGMRTAIYSRPGYGTSTRRAGRIIADEAATSAALADHLGHGSFYTAGWSGGGPVALACAALLPDRIRACLTLGSLAPWQEAGDISAFGFRPEDQREWEILGSEDPSELIPTFEEAAANGDDRTPESFASNVRSNDADRAAILGPGGLGDAIASSMRRAYLTGWFGHYDDNIAEARPWGFRVAEIRVPVVVRHGDGDGWVSIEHGRWLASTIPGARRVFPTGAGHTSIMVPFEEVVAELVEVGGP
jgi:pimeloyl-ACP methyl ester carboxylesterase